MWSNKEVQKVIVKKKNKFKKWQRIESIEVLLAFYGAIREVKRIVSKLKRSKFEEVYSRLNTKDKVNEVHILVKTRERRTRDFTNIRYVKGEIQKNVINRKDIKRGRVCISKPF